MPRVLGIDPSLSGFTIADAWMRPVGNGTSSVVTEIVTVPAPPATQELRGRILRFEELARRAIDRIRTAEPDAVFLEGYSYNSRGAVVLLGEFGGVFRCRLLEVALLDPGGFPVYEVPPATLKKFATGKGNANKAQVTSALASRYGRTFASDDEADAFGLSELGLVVVGARPASNEAQREAAAAVLGNAEPRKKKGRKKKGKEAT